MRQEDAKPTYREFALLHDSGDGACIRVSSTPVPFRYNHVRGYALGYGNSALGEL